MGTLFLRSAAGTGRLPQGRGVALFWTWGGWVLFFGLAALFSLFWPDGLGIWLSIIFLPLASLMTLIGLAGYLPWVAIGRLRALNMPACLLALAAIGAVLYAQAPPAYLWSGSALRVAQQLVGWLAHPGIFLVLLILVVPPARSTCTNSH
jgi:hypothetical protein